MLKCSGAGVRTAPAVGAPAHRTRHSALQHSALGTSALSALWHLGTPAFSTSPFITRSTIPDMPDLVVVHRVVHAGYRIAVTSAPTRAEHVGGLEDAFLGDVEVDVAASQEHGHAVEAAGVGPHRARRADEPSAEPGHAAGKAGRRGCSASSARHAPCEKPIRTMRVRGAPASSTCATTSPTAASAELSHGSLDSRGATNRFGTRCCPAPAAPAMRRRAD